MYYLLLQNYNNYRNRTYKRLDTAPEYKAAVITYYENVTKSTNFDVSDGINMEHIFNGSFSGEPDYLLLLSETDSSIDSRWFVIEWKKIRGNQYRAILRRDLLADNYETITTAPSFIEKGWVPSTDSAIFNKEDMTFNQIKKSETLLRDETKVSWIVGYVANNASSIAQKDLIVTSPEAQKVVNNTWANWEYHDLVDDQSHTTVNVDNADQTIKFWLYYQEWLNERNRVYTFNKNTGWTNTDIRPDYFKISYEDWSSVPSTWRSSINWNTCIEKVYLDNPSWISASRYAAVYDLIGKTIQFTDGYYRITGCVESDSLEGETWLNSGNLFNYIEGVITTNLAPHGIQSVSSNPVCRQLSLKTFRFTYEKIQNTPGTYKYSIPDTVNALKDAPYKMFCIPLPNKDGENLFVSTDGTTYRQVEYDTMIQWAIDIAKEFQSNIYDLQILPYCPLEGMTSPSDYHLYMSVPNEANRGSGYDYNELMMVVPGGGLVMRGLCYWALTSTCERVLTYSIEVDDTKIENECDMYRLCSPNYASVFEFNPAKNGGVESYIARFTYKPYNPFIYVAPKFGRLYGKDFKDNRGLVLTGDFSLPLITDQWKQYEINNKNYLLAFDRQIQNMEVQYKWQRTLGVTSAIVGSLQGGATGVFAGSMIGGGPVGMGIGAAVAAVGTAGAIAGGVADLAMQQALHDESIDFAKDNFGYQLGNIKALPNTINKVSSIVANSKFFPFVEKYSCTDEEKEALRNKIKYNGMSIGRIGRITDFLNPADTTYVKGQIIRLEGDFDAHTANQIAEEFNKGWYI